MLPYLNPFEAILYLINFHILNKKSLNFDLLLSTHHKEALSSRNSKHMRNFHLTFPLCFNAFLSLSLSHSTIPTYNDLLIRYF